MTSFVSRHKGMKYDSTFHCFFQISIIGTKSRSGIVMVHLYLGTLKVRLK